MKIFLNLLVVWFVFGVCSAKAALISSLPDATVIPFPTTAYSGSDPQVIGVGITWSSTNFGNPESVLGYVDNYDFGTNGSWQNISMAGLNSSSDYLGTAATMTFTFDSPVMGVGGLINYYPNSTNPVISVYDSSYLLIESATLDFSTGGETNTGMFLGFMEDSNTIKYFALTDAYIGITNLTVAEGQPPAPVPEPATVLLFGTGLAGLFMSKRKRFHQPGERLRSRRSRRKIL